MRSRYAAYALDKIDHIVATHDPANRDQIDENSAHQWARESTWLGLEVVATEGGHETDDTGMVEFIARYAVKGRDFAHHERALFERKNGTWFYMDGHIVKPKPVVRPAPKVGRNEPCPCGSERKFKKCCGAAA